MLHHIRHAACKLFGQLGLRDVARLDGWVALQPGWAERWGGWVALQPGWTEQYKWPQVGRRGVFFMVLAPVHHHPTP